MKKKERLNKYKKLLVEKNQNLNLVSKKQEKNLDYHIRECLSAAPLLRETIIDLGSGGGLPGILLSIESPNKKIFLVEASQKKASFLLHTKNLLELKNLEVINKRGESLDPEEFPQPLDIITRAFGEAKLTIEITRKFLEIKKNKLKLMKTEGWEKREPLPKNYEVKKTEELPINERDKKRILVTIVKKLNA